MMQQINKLFRDDKNQKKNLQYKFTIDTGQTEERLKKVVTLLGEVKLKADNIRTMKLNIDPGKIELEYK